MSDRRNSATYRAITGSAGARSARTEPRGWLQSIARVVADAGSVAGAARDLGVPRRTLRRWLTGEGTPSAARQAQVQRAATAVVRRTRLTPAREKRLRAATTVTIVAVYRYDQISVRRTIVFSLNGGNGPRDMARTAVQDVLDAFLAGGEGRDVDIGDQGDTGLFGPLVHAMSAPPEEWYRDHFSFGTDDEHGFDVEKVTFR